jgi:hypothetical protein
MKEVAFPKVGRLVAPLDRAMQTHFIEFIGFVSA